jgi:hypothetical protein
MSTYATRADLRRLAREVGGEQQPAGSSELSGPECDRLWSVTDVGRFLGVPISTLHQWRYLGRGPAAFRVGKHLRYDPHAVRRWLVDDCADEPA